MTENLSEQKIEEYRKAFNYVDSDENGEIDVSELRLVFEQLGFNLPESEMIDIIGEFGEDHAGDTI